MQGELSSEEVMDAENYLIKMSQHEQKVFKEEYTALMKQKEIPNNSRLIGLNPRLDSNGVIRSDGRLTYVMQSSYLMV